MPRFFETRLPQDGGIAASAYSAPRPIVGSSERVTLDKSVKRRVEKRTQSAWQTAAWQAFDSIGEVHYAFSLIGQIMSRVRIYAAVVEDPDQPPVHVTDYIDRLEEKAHASADATREVLEAARDAMTDLSARSSHGSLSGLLRQMAINLSVPGEFYFCDIPERGWTVASTDELTQHANGKMRYRRSKTQTTRGANSDVELPEHAFVARVWRPHPRYSGEPDSSMLGVLDDCELLILLQQVMRTITRSRMNAGMVFVPDGVQSFSADSDELTLEESLAQDVTQSIEDESALAAVVPKVFRGPAGLKPEWIEYGRRVDEPLLQQVDRTLQRILQGLDIPKDVVTGLADVKYCLDEATECLTRDRGWVTHDQLCAGDIVLTLDHETGLSEWQPATAVNVFDAVDEPVLSLSSRDHASISTHAHRWPVVRRLKDGTYAREWRTSAELTASCSVETAVPHRGLPVEQKYSDALVELMAWFTTEGHVRKPPLQPWASIAQSGSHNPGHVSRIRKCLEELFGPETPPGPLGTNTPASEPRWHRRETYFMLNPQAFEQIRPYLDGPAHDKVVSREFIYSLTRAQLELFIETMNKGDGSASRSMVLQKHEPILDRFDLACFLAGKTCHRIKAPAGAHCSAVHARSTTHLVPAGSKRKSREVERTTYTGKVWCPTTPNQTWFARKNGKTFWTGNSNAVVIDENLYRAHVEPLVLLVCDAITSVYLRPVLRKKTTSPDLINRVVVWADTSAIVTRSDKSQAANEGFDRSLLSARAWREARGFTDADAPDERELVQRLILSRGSIPEEISDAVIRSIDPEFFQAARAGNSEIPADIESLLSGEVPPTAPTEPSAAERQLQGGEVNPNGTLPPRP